MKFFTFCFLSALTSLSLYSQELTQTIRGTVMEKESRSGIPGASVSLLDDASKQNVTTTDAKGNFRLENVSLGRHTLKINYIGYYPVILQNIIVDKGKESIINVELEEAVTKMEEVNVTSSDKGNANNDMSTVSNKNFSMEEANRYAGSRGDPARMASNFAGVNSADDSRNDIVIRGNTPAGVLWSVDGVTIPNPNHFAVPGTTGGPVCILNNKTFGNSDFMTGAFPAEYGNTNAGVFDIKLRNGNNEKQEFTAQFGLLGMEAAAEGPISKKTGATYLITYRYSTLKILGGLHIPIGTSSIPDYQDASFKLNFPTKNSGNFSLFGVGGVSDVFVKLSDKTYDEIELYGDNNRDQLLKSSMGIVGASYSKSINDKTFIKTTLSAYGQQVLANDQIFYRNPVTYITDTIFPKMRYTFRSGKYSLNFNINHKFNAKTTLKAGITVDDLLFNLHDSNYVESIHKWDVRENYMGSTQLIQPFVQIKYKPTDKVTFNVGLHAQYLTLNGSSSVEPRAGIRWNFTNTQCLSFGYGMHSQMQANYIYFHQIINSNGQNEMVNKDLGFTRAQHFVLGYEKKLKRSSRFLIETYYQMLYDVPVDTMRSSYSLLNQGSMFDPPYPGKLVNKGTGYNYGVELTIEKFFDKSFFALFTTSLYQSKYKGSDGIERNTDYNGNYIVNLVAGKEFKIGTSGKKVFTVSGKVTSSGGRRYSPADVAASAATGSLVEIDSLRNTLQFRNYFRFDLKIGYKVSTKRATHEIAFDLVNLFNTKNILGLTYAPDPSNPTGDPIKKEYQLGFLPLFYYKVDF
ncbi:MAG: carboxypeptidase regulatory-like domain-containing protein [Bacteroidia bacterium]